MMVVHETVLGSYKDTRKTVLGASESCIYNPKPCLQGSWRPMASRVSSVFGGRVWGLVM